MKDEILSKRKFKKTLKKYSELLELVTENEVNDAYETYAELDRDADNAKLDKMYTKLLNSYEKLHDFKENSLNATKINGPDISYGY